MTCFLDTLCNRLSVTARNKLGGSLQESLGERLFATGAGAATKARHLILSSKSLRAILLLIACLSLLPINNAKAENLSKNGPRIDYVISYFDELFLETSSNRNNIALWERAPREWSKILRFNILDFTTNTQRNDLLIQHLRSAYFSQGVEKCKLGFSFELVDERAEADVHIVLIDTHRSIAEYFDKIVGATDKARFQKQIDALRRAIKKIEDVDQALITLTLREHPRAAAKKFQFIALSLTQELEPLAWQSASLAMFSPHVIKMSGIESYYNVGEEEPNINGIPAFDASLIKYLNHPSREWFREENIRDSLLDVSFRGTSYIHLLYDMYKNQDVPICGNAQNN